jgi:hypothetical protein
MDCGLRFSPPWSQYGGVRDGCFVTFSTEAEQSARREDREIHRVKAHVFYRPGRSIHFPDSCSEIGDDLLSGFEWTNDAA